MPFNLNDPDAWPFHAHPAVPGAKNGREEAAGIVGFVRGIGAAVPVASRYGVLVEVPYEWVGAVAAGALMASLTVELYSMSVASSVDADPAFCTLRIWATNCTPATEGASVPFESPNRTRAV